MLMKSFIESQFAYAPLLNLFQSRELNNKINNLHYRALKSVYRDDFSTFQELKKDNLVTIHHRNIQNLAIQLYKVKSGSAPCLLKEIFTMRDILENSIVANLRSQTDFYNNHNPKSVRFGTETLRALGPKIWDIIPSNIKKLTSLESVKNNIKNWVPLNCRCYIQDIGFID